METRIDALDIRQRSAALTPGPMSGRIAGSIGIDPRPLTLRQLLWMAEGLGARALVAHVADLRPDRQRQPRPQAASALQTHGL